MGAKVRLENVTKKFGEVTAIKEVNVEVIAGEFFVVVGPNGCGKTTLLRLIAGLTNPDAGDIYLDDELVNDVKPGARGVQMVFQNYALWPHMRVFDGRTYANLNFGLKIRKFGKEEIKTKIDSVTSKVGISRRLFKRKPPQLSAGEQQKVAVGRSMSMKPRVFLMDEPLANLDPQARLKIRKEIQNVHRDLETTTIYVTHNLAEAMAMGERMAIMREGTIQQVGSPKEIYLHPANDFVADFIKCFEFTRPF